jgi:hypothetical protein
LTTFYVESGIGIYRLRMFSEYWNGFSGGGPIYRGVDDITGNFGIGSGLGLDCEIYKGIIISSKAKYTFIYTHSGYEPFTFFTWNIGIKYAL